MQTLETMVQDTKIGAYAGFVYSLIIVIASAITYFVQVHESMQQDKVIQQQVANVYGLSETSAKDVMCFQGILHYKNVGILSGALAFTPNIHCSESELAKLQTNSAANVASISLLFLILGLLTLFITYHKISKDNGWKNSL